MTRTYAGILVTATDVRATVASAHVNSSRFDAVIAALKPMLKGHIIGAQYGERPARDVIKDFVAGLRDAYPSLDAVGIGSYGPLCSIAPGHSGYGTVSQTTIHDAIRGVDVLAVIRDVFSDGRGTMPKLRIQTDVMAGAFGEAYRRRHAGGGVGRRGLQQNDTLAFLHVKDGIGGAVVVGDDPILGAHHTEFGYITVQVEAGDTWAEGVQSAAASLGRYIVLEDVASEHALRNRAKGLGIDVSDARWMERLPKRVWEFEGRYLAQLCATVTMAHAPHQIVIDSPLISPALLQWVREGFRRRLQRGSLVDRGILSVGLYNGYDEVEATDRYIQAPIAPAPMLYGSLALGVREDLGLS